MQCVRLKKNPKPNQTKPGLLLLRPRPATQFAPGISTLASGLDLWTGWSSPRGNESIKAAADIHAYFFFFLNPGSRVATFQTQLLPRNELRTPKMLNTSGTRAVKWRRTNGFKYIKNIRGVSQCSSSGTCVSASSNRRCFYEGRDTKWLQENCL